LTCGDAPSLSSERFKIHVFEHLYDISIADKGTFVCLPFSAAGDKNNFMMIDREKGRTWILQTYSEALGKDDKEKEVSLIG